MMKQYDAVQGLAAIAHDGRLTLMRALIKAGPDGVAAGELARSAGVNATTASAQLLVLTNAALVTSERKGRSVIYYANFARMTELLGFLLLDCCAGHPQICAPIKTVAEQ